MKILVVCLGNVNRSPMGEVLLRAAGFKQVRSRGLAAGGHLRASPKARTYAEAHGLNLEAHRAEQLTKADAEWADVILVMSPRHAERVKAMAPRCNALKRGRLINLAAYNDGPKESIPDPGFMKTGSAEVKAAFAMLHKCVDRFIIEYKGRGEPA